MAPHVPCRQGLAILNLCLRPAARRPALSLQPLIQTANLSQKEKKRMMKQEPYKWAQIQARKAAKVERQQKIQSARDAAWGSPVHGIPTPFVESFDSAGQRPTSTPPKAQAGVPQEEHRALPTSPEILNHQLSRTELDEAIAMAYQLSKPLENVNRIVVDSVNEANELREHEERHKKAVIALHRITSLDNASSKGIRHANIRRCIETFGRHKTDNVLRPKPRAPGLPPREQLQRAGPDTGSPEVQIAILTAKIRVLARAFEGRKGNNDKFNRRNLRLLCHRRQKLLKYLERKERGSERWTSLIASLGLSPATWKEQIAI